MDRKYLNFPIIYGGIEWWLWQILMLGLLMIAAGLGRLGFIFWNINLHEVSLIELAQTFFYGFRLDLSISSYILLIFNLFTFILFFKPRIGQIFHALIYFVMVLLVVLYVLDIVLYSYWGFKIDKSVFRFLATPKDAAASASYGFILLIIAVIAFASRLMVYLYRKFLKISRLTFSFRYFLPGILLLPILFLLGRGSIDVAGVNESSAYFSQKPELNHAAVNGPWNFFSSMVNIQRRARLQWNDSLSKYLENFSSACNKPQALLNIEQPNIVLVILESFSANLLDLNDVNGDVVPNLRKIASEGYFFPNCYAAGSRSDKGLSAILTGYPAHPYGSIMKYPHKFEKLPRLIYPFNKQGYHTAFYYGGNADFANFRGLFVSNGFQKIIAQESFARRQRTSKWGVHDHIVMQRFWEDILLAEQPFFYSIFTLSSHEPFDVPHRSKFLDKTPKGKFLNSIYFTDSVVGIFYEQFKNSSLWNSTILIFIADHGHYFPLLSRQEMPSHYRIPFIISGGALSSDYHGRINEKIISQSDIPYSLLKLLGLQSPVPFPFERNIFCADYNAPVGYIFNFGYGVLTPAGEEVIYDNGASYWVTQKVIDSTTAISADAWFRYVISLYED